MTHRAIDQERIELAREITSLLRLDDEFRSSAPSVIVPALPSDTIRYVAALIEEAERTEPRSETEIVAVVVPQGARRAFITFSESAESDEIEPVIKVPSHTTMGVFLAYLQTCEDGHMKIHVEDPEEEHVNFEVLKQLQFL